MAIVYMALARMAAQREAKAWARAHELRGTPGELPAMAAALRAEADRLLAEFKAVRS